MGASHSQHVRGTLKITDGGENVRVKYATSSMQGWCAKMEDACAVVPDLDGTTTFFGVYDGHGGADVALFCAKRLHIVLRGYLNHQSNLNDAVRSAFFRTDELLQQSNEWMEFIKPSDSNNWIQKIMGALFFNHWPFTKATPYIAPQFMGSTACVAVIKSSRFSVANVGHSRCVISKKGKGIELSNEHKAFEPGESRRIIKAGGRVWKDKTVLIGERIPLLGISKVAGVLAIPRVIGDFAFKQNKNLLPSEQMAICDPHLQSMEITNDIEFLVIASQGIWECMTCQDVVDFVHEEFKSGETDLRVICERLVDRAMPDANATAILLKFKDRASASAAAAAEDEGSRDQDIAPEPSEQPIPGDDTVARALAFLKGKQKEIAEGSKPS